MRVALQRGIRMPRDLSVIGFDGLPHGALFCPALTTVTQPMREMGRIACCRLFEAIENPGRIETTEFPMALLERESAGPAPGGGSRPGGLHLVSSPVGMTRAALWISAIAAAAILSFRPIYEPDLWWHLAHGRENLTGHIVRTNLFSFTYPDYRQRYTSWLFDTGSFVAWQIAGPVGIQAGQALLLTAALLILFAACRVRAPAWSAAAVLALGFFILEPRAIPRPHLVSFAGLAASAWLIERSMAKRTAAPLWWTVPLIAVWSNFHVECVFGVLLLAVFSMAELIWPSWLTRRQAWQAVGIATLAGLATMLNPYGWGLAAYLYENLSVPRIVAIAELQPPRLPAYRAFFAYLVLTGGLLAAQPRRLTLSEAAIAIVFGTLGVMHLRETPLVLLATAPMVAARLSALTARGLDYRAILITTFAGALALSRIPLPLLFTEFRAGRAAVEPPQFFSPQAVAFIQQKGLEGPVFNSHNLGGYLTWSLYPRVRIFQDSRLQAYPPEHFRRIIEASASQEAWNALVAGVDWAVISVRRPNQLAGTGRFPATDWASVYQDDAIEIVVRRKGKFSAGLASAAPANETVQRTARLVPAEAGAGAEAGPRFTGFRTNDQLPEDRRQDRRDRATGSRLRGARLSSSASTPAHPSAVSSGTTSAPLLSGLPFISQVCPDRNAAAVTLSASRLTGGSCASTLLE